MNVRLTIVPCDIKDARAYVQQHHRHRDAPPGAKFAVACALGDLVVGVAIAGLPIARPLNDGWTIEITRCCTDGSRNACSILYRACVRSALSLGFRRVITYSLQSESGASLRAAGFRVVADVRGRQWDCPSRPRPTIDEPQDKLRWEAA